MRRVVILVNIANKIMPTIGNHDSVWVHLVCFWLAVFIKPGMQALVYRVIAILKHHAPVRRNRFVQNVEAVHELWVGGAVQTLPQCRLIPLAAKGTHLRRHIPALGVRNARVIHKAVGQQIQFRFAEFMLIVPAVPVFQRVASRYKLAQIHAYALASDLQSIILLKPFRDIRLTHSMPRVRMLTQRFQYGQRQHLLWDNRHRITLRVHYIHGYAICQFSNV